MRVRLSDPAALTAGHRADMAPVSLVEPPTPVPAAPCPTLGIWSTGDMALTEQQMPASADHVESRWRYGRIEGAGHRIPLDAPEALSGLLVEHLAASAAEVPTE